MDEATQWEILKQLIKARYLLMFKAHKKPLYQYRADMDRAICLALGLDYYETTAEDYKKAVQEVMKNDDDL